MKTLSAISRRLSLMIGRCVIRAAEASGGRVLVALEGLEDEGGSGCELAEPTSFTSVPPSGAEGVALSIMGERGHRVILSLGDRRFRPRDLTQGEASLFDCAGGGNRIDVLKDRIRITAPARIGRPAPPNSSGMGAAR